MSFEADPQLHIDMTMALWESPSQRTQLSHTQVPGLEELRSLMVLLQAAKFLAKLLHSNGIYLLIEVVRLRSGSTIIGKRVDIYICVCLSHQPR